MTFSNQRLVGPSKRLLLSALLLLSFLPLVVNAQTDFKELHIDSRWLGMGPLGHSELTITHKSGGYFVNGDRVKDQLISALITALYEPVVPKLELANLGITQQWLDANAAPGVEEYASYYFSSAAPNQRELYFSSFKNLKFIEQTLPALFSSGWTDDYPIVKITVTAADGRPTTLTSDVQSLFMLPWKVARDGATVENYNAHISRAIADLLSKKFTNKDRLAGDGLRRKMAEDVLDWIKPDWKRLEAENRAGPELARLRTKYTIVESDVNSYHNVDFGVPWDKGIANETNLWVRLKRSDFPASFFVSVVLPVRQDKVESVDLFLDSIERYRALFGKINWLTEYFATHPNMRVELRFVTDRSFSSKAMGIFAGDMKKLGKTALADEVAAVQKDVSLIMVGRDYVQAYWLILPDQRLVLWRFGGYDTLLKWRAEDFTFKDCDQYQGKCVGAVISAAGTISAR